jgi:DNA-binding MarR family transcriptional regulator
MSLHEIFRLEDLANDLSEASSRQDKDAYGSPNGAVRTKEAGDVATIRQVEGLRTLTRALLSLVDNISASSGSSGRRSRSRRSSGVLAQRIYRERRRRERFFPSGLFGEPTWDILLDLFVAGEGNRHRAIKEVCLNSHVPDATALRYIEQLVEHRLVERHPDKTDNRRKFLRLTPKGARCMVGYLETMPRLGDDAEEIATDLVNPD